jgi:hypothetical protein
MVAWLRPTFATMEFSMNDYQEDLLDVHATEWEPAEPVDDATEL